MRAPGGGKAPSSTKLRALKLRDVVAGQPLCVCPPLFSDRLLKATEPVLGAAGTGKDALRINGALWARFFERLAAALALVAWVVDILSTH